MISLFTYNRIETTRTRAKEAKRYAERLITLGKDGSLHARRQALQLLPNKDVVKEIFNLASEKYKSRPGGYTRVINVGSRQGDGAPMSLLELVG